LWRLKDAVDRQKYWHCKRRQNIVSAVRQFFWLWIKTAFSHSWDRAQSIGTAIVVAIGLLALFVPSAKANEAGVIAIAFGLIIAGRLLLSPYWLYREARRERDAANSERNALRAQLENRVEETRRSESTKRLKDTIILQLSRLMAMGDRLLIKTRSLQSGPEIDAEAEKWFQTTKDFILASLGEAATAWFINTSGSTPADGAPDARYFWEARVLFDSINTRLHRLNEIIEKVQTGTIAPRE
jgi:hypothetical protein